MINFTLINYDRKQEIKERVYAVVAHLIWKSPAPSKNRLTAFSELKKPLTNSTGITTFGQATMNRKTFWWSKTVCELKSINLSATKKERHELSRGKPWALSWLFDPDFSEWMSPFCWRSKSPKKLVKNLGGKRKGVKEKKPKVNLAAIRMKEMQDLGRKQIAVNVIKKILGGGNSKTLFSLKNN